MATTRYRVAATPSSAEKVISSLKAARTEADARARLDRVDVEVTTVATGKVSYTAHGAPAPAEPEPAAPAAAEEPQAPAEEPTTPADDEPTGDDEDGVEFDADAFDAELVSILSSAAASETGSAFAAELAAAPADEDDEDEGEEGSEGDEDDAPAADDTPADDDADNDASDDEEPARPQPEHRGQAECGCSVETIVRTGQHTKDCADAPAREAKAEAVKRERPARAPRTGSTGGSRRPSQGPSVVDGWDLLYDKPRQQAQVGRNADGKYALICTTHKHAHQLQRLTQERGLRGGSRSVWCPDCK